MDCLKLLIVQIVVHDSDDDNDSSDNDTSGNNKNDDDELDVVEFDNEGHANDFLFICLKVNSNTIFLLQRVI